MPRICVIGAGPSGLTAVKNLVEAGLNEVTVFEKSGEVGGNWVYNELPGHSSVFKTTHIISSKKLSQYLDFPMPAHYPDYPSHHELREYFNAYCDEFGLREYINLDTEVTRAWLDENQEWQIELGDGKVEQFNHLLVCNGHHWKPRTPHYSGDFTGELLHSHDFKDSGPFAGKRVLIIGGGNSACDIAVETSRVASHVSISMRRGYYFIPKFILGKPVDTLNHGVRWLPRKLRNLGFNLLLKISVGNNEEYGLQKPDHPLLGSHPVVNSELLYFIRHGKIHPRQDVKSIDGNTVHFTNGTQSEFDTVITATGYVVTFPFFKTDFIDFREGSVPLFKKIFHPQYKNLFFIGLIQPMGCIWPLADAQSRLVASFINGEYKLPENITELIEKEIKLVKKRYIDTPRHVLEVEYHSYLTELLHEIPAGVNTG